MMTPSSPSSGRGYTQSERIASDIARRIQNGDLHEGDKLASEMTLAEQYDASRGTVRRALSLLQDRDLVQTRPGSGSYVAFHGVSLSGNEGWTAATLKVGFPTSTELVDLTRVDTPSALAQHTATDACWRIRRRRLLNSVPISFETSLIPANERIDTLLEYGLLGGSVSATMRATGMVTARGTQDVSVEPLPEDLATALHTAESAPFLVVRRTGFDRTDELTEHVTSWLSPQHFTIHMTFEE